MLPIDSMCMSRRRLPTERARAPRSRGWFLCAACGVVCAGCPPSNGLADRVAREEAMVKTWQAARYAPVGEHPLKVVILRADSMGRRLGLAPNSRAEEFADIRNGLLVSELSAVVSDIGNKRLVRVDQSGKVEVLIGPGVGPKELSEPTFLLNMGKGIVELWDNALGRRTMLDATLPAAQAVERSERYDGSPARGCRLGSVVALLGYDPVAERLGRFVPVVGTSRARRASWGLPLVQGSNALNYVISDGPLSM